MNTNFVYSQGRLMIIGGEGIGSAKLGMTKTEIDEINKTSKCPVSDAIYSDGKAVELRTATGGSCATPEGMMASTYGAVRLIVLYGEPEFIKNENNSYEGIKAVWWYYYNLGFAFRVLIFENGGNLVQMVAVFSKGLDI